MITASKDIFYNIMIGEWKGLNIRVLQVLGDGNVCSKVFKLEEFIFDEIDACEDCRATVTSCDQCDGVVEIVALLGYVKKNKRKVEEGVIIPLFGDVLFDLREGHVAILTDNDITVISRPRKNVSGDHDHKNDQQIIAGSDMESSGNLKVNSRMYLVATSKVKRLAINALNDGRLFHDLAAQKAIVVELTYVKQESIAPYIRSLRLFFAYFDVDGRVDQELTFPKSNVNHESIRESYLQDKVVKLGRRDKKPELTKNQKAILKKRLLHDFGEDTWDNTPMRVKVILE
ncbi:MAG: hypothetical protein LRZ99_05730 [Desulfotomaculum sp.]|nr:hypothetical protein [Desulfotomaculum sp.]MCL0081439.1 hypothetical protein [Peptococcaceae bacterium]